MVKILTSIILILSFWAVPSMAVDSSRFDHWTQALRCLKCDHQSIAESDSDFAKDMKGWLREQIDAGKTDDDIRERLRERFGDRIFFKPGVANQYRVIMAIADHFCDSGRDIFCKAGTVAMKKHYYSIIILCIALGLYLLRGTSPRCSGLRRSRICRRLGK